MHTRPATSPDSPVSGFADYTEDFRLTTSPEQQSGPFFLIQFWCYTAHSPEPVRIVRNGMGNGPEKFLFINKYVFRHSPELLPELLPPEAASQRSPPQKVFIYQKVYIFVILFFKKVFFPELLPPEAASQRSRPKKVFIYQKNIHFF